MRRHLKQRFLATDGDPGPLAWCLGAIGLVLPILGLMGCLAGGWLLWRGAWGGALPVGLGMAALALDLGIDLVWASPSISESDLPDLNRRSAQLIGRQGQVTTALRDGRGAVRIGDSEWPAEGPDVAAGVHVRVTAVRGIGVVVAPDGRSTV